MNSPAQSSPWIGQLLQFYFNSIGNIYKLKVMPIPIFGNKALVPSEIGSLELVNIHEYPNPRLGANFRYQNEVVKVDTYLYDLGILRLPDNLRSEAMHDIHTLAYMDILKRAEEGIYLDFEIATPEIIYFPDDTPEPALLLSSFRFRQEREPGVDLLGRRVSYLATRIDRGYINKVRYTYPESNEFAGERFKHFLCFFMEWMAALYLVPAQ